MKDSKPYKVYYNRRFIGRRRSLTRAKKLVAWKLGDTTALHYRLVIRKDNKIVHTASCQCFGGKECRKINYNAE